MITSLDLERINALPDAEAARVYDNRLRWLEGDYKRGFIERGLILCEMEERQLWKHLADMDGTPFHSMEQWVMRAAPYSRRDCFYARSAVKELRADIPLDQLLDTPRCNVALLQSLSSSVRREPEVIAAARALPEKDFRAKITQDFPQQHIEAKHKLTLTFSDSDYQTIVEALDTVKEEYAKSGVELDTRESQLLAWACNFLGNANERISEIKQDVSIQGNG